MRLIFSLGGGAADGAVDLDTAGLERRAAPARMRASGECRIIVREAAGVQRHDQGCIVTAALELMSRARIGMRAPIVSTLAPARFGALAAGPFAALLSGCSLHLHGPFEAARFIAEIDAGAPVHLVGPRALADALARDNRLEPSTFASLMLTGCGLSGEAIAVDFAGAGNPVIDLDRIDRDALASEPNAPMMQPERQASPVPAVMGAAKA